MVAENLKEFNVQWILFGLLFFCMMTFTVLFMESNNEEGLVDNYGNDISGKFGGFASNISGSLEEVEIDSNSMLNISSQTNPEISDQGSKDSVATSYGIFGTASKMYSSTKLFLSWMVSGTTGSILISVFIGVMGFVGLAFITKWIRQGY